MLLPEKPPGVLCETLVTKTLRYLPACLVMVARRSTWLFACSISIRKEGSLRGLVGIVSVENLDALTIKAAIEYVLRDHSFSWSRVREQGV